MDSMRSTKKSGHSLTKSSYNISNGVQPGGRVVLTIGVTLCILWGETDGKRLFRIASNKTLFGINFLKCWQSGLTLF